MSAGKRRTSGAEALLYHRARIGASKLVPFPSFVKGFLFTAGAVFLLWDLKTSFPSRDCGKHSRPTLGRSGVTTRRSGIPTPACAFRMLSSKIS